MKVSAITELLRRHKLYRRLRQRDRTAGAQLHLVQDRLAAIKPRDILLVTCLRNERFRLPFFVDYYRGLGVQHFLMIDNDSSDGFMEWAREQADVSVWHTTASYKDSNFGMLWCNDLLYRHGTGHWCVVVDPDEFLVYPYMNTRSLSALRQFLEDDKRECFHAIMLDAYSDRPLGQTLLEPGSDPFGVCPYFDRDGYTQRAGWANGAWIQGGVRMRCHFRDRPWEAPALNKIPFIKWQRNFHYRMSTHDAYPLRLNRAHNRGEVSATGALFHFKFVSSLKDKAKEEMQRREHYAGGREYERYLGENDSFYEEGVSIRYEGPEQLIRLGLMSPGGWF